MGAGRDGVSVPRLVDAAREYGFHVDVSQDVDPVATPPDAPAILYLSERHFVVMETVGRRGVRIADPAVGRTWLPVAEFHRRYGNALIRLRPGSYFARRRTPLRQMLIVRYLREFVAAPSGRRLLLVVALLAIALQGLGLVLPATTRVVVDTMIPGRRTDLLPVLGIVVVGTSLLNGGLSLARAWTLLALRARADTALSGRFIGHLLRLPLSFFMHRKRGDLLMRLGSVSSTREMVTQQVLTVVLDAALLTGYLAALSVVAPGYLAVVAVLAALNVLLIGQAYGRIGALAQRELTAKSEEQSYLVEALEAVGPVKANGAEPRVEQHWQGLFGTYREAMVRRSRFTALIEAGQQALAVATPLALLWFAVSSVLSGRMTLGTALAANTMALSVLAPVQTMAAAGQVYSTVRSQIERLYDVMDAAEEPTGVHRLDRGRPIRVDLAGVTFRYYADAPAVLSDIWFTAPAGGKVGIVGATGSGKSTIALLVLGLLRPTGGEVWHDGVPIADLDLADLRGSCGAVLQELSLFNSTIRDNITLGRPGITDADLAWAAGVAGLHADVLRLPMGYETLVGGSGAALSAGQRQRVALARALAHQPRLLILDEATSHLDPGTERRVDEALSHLNVTRIVISHRLSAVRNADQILVVEQGRITARGRHDHLVSQPGTYRDLFGADSAAADGGPAEGRLRAVKERTA
jgi:ABC-type bacteriocin/lantibiotic exporter with double-glycine peptidase domain